MQASFGQVDAEHDRDVPEVIRHAETHEADARSFELAASSPKAMSVTVGPTEQAQRSAAAGSEPALSSSEAGWTTRARIRQRAQTRARQAAPESAPEIAPKPEATEPVPVTARTSRPGEAAAAPVEPQANPDTQLELDVELEQGVLLGADLGGTRRRAGVRDRVADARGERGSDPHVPGAWPTPPQAIVRVDASPQPGDDADAPTRRVEPHARGPPPSERAQPTTTPDTQAHPALRTEPGLVMLAHGEALLRAPAIQAKLAVSAPGDPFEIEADAVAARVLHGTTPRPPVAGVIAGGLARAPPHQRGPPREGFPASVGAALQSGGGHALDPALRTRIEPHVGVDLSHVRVRREPAAAAAAHDLRARAFTSGASIFLAAGSSPSDIGLIAHEAAHVAQQSSNPAARTTLQRLSVDDLIPDWILDGVRDAVRALPGYTILTTIVGEDLLTGAPATTSREELVETLLTYGPFGAAVGPLLTTIDVLGDVFSVISEGLAANDLTLARIGRDIETAWNEFSIANGISGNLAIVERLVAALLRDVSSFVSAIVDRVIELVRSVVAAVAEPLLETPEIKPIWDLTKKVLHYDPLRGQPVEAPTVDIIADFLRVIGEEERLAQMQERGTLQETADWLDTQLATFQGLVGELGILFSDAWAAIQPANLPDLLTNLEALAARAFGFVQRVGDFGATLILKVLELVKHALLSWLSEHAHSVPGFHLLTVILEQNPFTGEAVQRNARNLIRGFITLMPGGEATFDQLAESGVIDQAADRIDSEMARLGISIDLITGIFLGIWDTLTLDDLLDPIGAFGRILALFGEPLARLIEFIAVVIEVVITLILRLMNFPSDLLGSIIANALQAMEDIQRDPVGFLVNMLEAVKLGFTGFLDHILGHLTQGLAAWLFRGLGQLGIQLPTDFSLGSILNLVFQVLGLTIEHLWEKLGEHIGPERVAMIRGAIDQLTGAWAFIVEVQRDGLSAIWRFVVDQLSGLWTTLLSMATEWIMTRVVATVTTRLLSLLDPTGIMAVVNSFIAFFAAVQSAIEYLRDILEIINRYVTTFAQVAAGNIVPGAQMLEQGLASAIPVAIGFLANQVGLGNIPEKVVEIIGRLRELVDRALDWLIGQAVRLGQAALNALGLRRSDEAGPEDAQTRHETILRELVPRLQEDAPQPEIDDAAWFAGKQRRAQALATETQPQLDAGVRIRIEVAQGQVPRQLLYEMDIAPNTTSLAGATAPPQLTAGEVYTYFDDMRGTENPVRGRFVSTATIGGRMVLRYDPGEARRTEYKMSSRGRPLGHFPTNEFRPALRSDGTPNYRLAGVGGGENPVFRVLSSRSTPNGTLAEAVEAEPLALAAYSAPREVPPGLARISAPLASSGAWLPGHLVNGEMGGPGTNVNMATIPRVTNAQMRGNYENTLRGDLQLGKYYYFHASVGYHAASSSSVIGRPSDFVQRITVSYQEITKAGSAWTRTGSLTVRPPYVVNLPDPSELEPSRLAG